MPRAPIRRVSRRRCVALLAACGGLAACVANPVTGRPELSLMSEAREAELGRRAAEQVAQQIGLVEDPELVAWVEAVGRRVASRSPRPGVVYRFAVADMPEANAFALPGGWIYVSRGLLALVNSEDELANVLGHEVGHVAARHAAQRETRTAGLGLLAALGALAAGAAGGQGAAETAAQLGQIAGAGLIASYGRDQERQADEVGQRMAAEAGFDPSALSSFLATLEREDALRETTLRRPGFLDSHPSASERVGATAARASRLGAPAASAPGGRGAFLRRLEGLLVGPDPAQGVFRGSTFLHPGFGLVLDFPPGWDTQNARDAVGAASPERDAMLVLQVQGPPEDPLIAARRFAEASRLPLEEGGRLRVGGWDAYRAWTQASSRSGPVGVELTWVAHPSASLRLAGMAAAARYRQQAASLRAAADSLRPLSGAQRRALRELRLRVVRMRSGESWEQLSRRTGNRWTPAFTAVANGLPPQVGPTAGAQVKIAVEVPYAP